MRVVANGISSHCVPFCHRHVRQPCAGATETGCCCCVGEAAAGSGKDCSCEEMTMDPRLARLQARVDTLQRSVQRIGTLTAPELPKRQPKESH